VRGAALGASLVASADAVVTKGIELAAHTRLAHDEAAALPKRLAVAERALAAERERERALQARYAALIAEMDDLRTELAVPA
jgi:hypothetical protein